MQRTLDIVILGLSITSSWGNGHATTYRGLVRELDCRGHRVLFLERDVAWYAAHRDLPAPPYGRTALYESLADLERRFLATLRAADVVVVGSFVPEGVAIGELVLSHGRGTTVFYDIDTPVTLARLARGEEDYITTALMPRYDLYLSFTGGDILGRLERHYGVRRARALYCSVDPEHYRPLEQPRRWLLGYLGTHCPTRMPALERLLLTPAQRMPQERFIVAGAQFPPARWPSNVERVEHVPPSEHQAFYGAQAFTLNLTRADMVEAGYSPSVRLFEAAASGVPIISDRWRGLDTFFAPDKEILLASSTEEILAHLSISRRERARLAMAARERVLAEHTPAHRAETLLTYLREAGC